MIFEYTLEENHFLNYHLFTISEDEKTIKRLGSLKFIIAGIFLFLAINNFKNNTTLTITYSIFAVLAFVFFNKYFKYILKKQHSKIVKKAYTTRFGKKETLEFTSDYIISETTVGEGKIKINAVEVINEIENIFFIKLSNNSSIIIPKKDIDIKNFKEKCEELNIPISDQLSWKW